MATVNPGTRNDDRYTVDVRNCDTGEFEEIDLRDLETGRLRQVRDHAWQNSDKDLAGRVDEVLASRNA